MGRLDDSDGESDDSGSDEEEFVDSDIVGNDFSESVAELKRRALGRVIDVDAFDEEDGDGDGYGDRDGDSDSDSEEYDEGEEEDGGDAAQLVARLRSELGCAICCSLLRDPVALLCGHAFCRACLRASVLAARPKKAKCASCRAKLRDRDEESPCCVALRNVARLLQDAKEAREERRDLAAEAAEHRAELQPKLADVTSIVERASDAHPRLWERLPCTSAKLRATRTVRRSGRHHTLFLALRISRETDLDSASEMTAALLLVEDDEAEADGRPWVLSDESHHGLAQGEMSDEAFIAIEQTGRELSLEVNGEIISSGDLNQGEVTFQLADGLNGFECGDGEPILVRVIDDAAGLEYRLAFFRKRADDDGEGDSSGGDGASDSDDDSEDDSDEASDDSFIVHDEPAADEPRRGGSDEDEGEGSDDAERVGSDGDERVNSDGEDPLQTLDDVEGDDQESEGDYEQDPAEDVAEDASVPDDAPPPDEHRSKRRRAVAAENGDY